eukprot:c22365_g1_i1 orf=300-3116(-)
MAAASSTRQKQQWRPSRGGGRGRGVTDQISVNSSGSSSNINLNPSSADNHRSDKDFRIERCSSSFTAAVVVPSPSSSSSSLPPAAAPPPSSAHMYINRKGSLIPYLPHDDAVAAGLGADQGGIDAVETQHVADILNEELGRLLKLQPLEFWNAVTADNSIEVSLDSYLQFRRRWYDSRANESCKPLAGVIVGDQELFRHVFMVLYRMSLSLENGSWPTGNDVVPEERAEYQRRFFDIPKLLDICAIYSHDNANPTGQLVNNAFAMNERLYDDLIDIVPVIWDTVQTMQQRCSSTLTMQLPTKNSEVLAMSKIQQELLEVLDYLNDAVISLFAFVDAYPEGATVLVLAGNNSDLKDQILFTLAAMHDSLIPIVRKSFTHLQGSCTDSVMESAAETHSKRLRFNLIDLVWRLLCFSYLKESNKEDSRNSTVNRLLKTYISDPRARGEALLQVLSGMVEDSSKPFMEEAIISGALIRNIDRKYKLLERVNQLRKNGLIFLDSVQCDYAETLIIHTSAVISSSSPNHSVLPLSTQELSEADVLNESKVSHIKDILPDYGSGFIAACLEAYDNNPEEVIQRILEGTLHPTLQSLDITLEVKPSSQNASVPVKDKGKGKVDEAPSQKGSSGNSAETVTRIQKARWQDDAKGLAQRQSSSMSASSSSANEDRKRLSANSSDAESTKDLKGRFVRKDKGGENAQLLLNERLPDDVLRTAAYAAQYEDEYDDSFDDLGTHIADGVEETEILVDLARTKLSAGGERGFHQANKMSTGSRSDGIGKGGWAVNNRATHEAKGTSARETNTRIVETQRQGQPQTTRGRGRGRRNEPRGQFYVKDGVNYSYKVAGSVAVASVEDAEALKKVERETIYGLRQGGNVPMSNEQVADGKNSAQGSPHMKWGSTQGEPAGRGGAQSRGRGAPRRDHDHHHRKDRAMQKHFAGLGGM